ncbi:hypothetical protein VPH35_110281 [Triticum aestivum]
MAAAASDRLSVLSDDLLRHILSFAPAREAARTTALSHRWRRPLWLETGAINLDYRSYTTGGGLLIPLQCRAVEDAGHALARHRSHGRVPTKIAVVMRDEPMDEEIVRWACGGDERVEELRLDCKDGAWPPFTSCALFLELCSLPLDSLPFVALRILDLRGCILEPLNSLSRLDPPRGVAFPCLEALRLRLCIMKLGTLQDMVHAAPKLADLRLESLRFLDRSPSGSPATRWLPLRCPAASVVAVTNMATRDTDACSLELDAPCLRRFRYTQIVPFDASVSFKSPSPGLERVHLEAHSAASLRSVHFCGGVCHARSLKLTVYSIADIDGVHLPMFPNLEHLGIEELCGWCLDSHGAAANAILNLLRSSPYLNETADETATIVDFTACKQPSLKGDDEHDDNDCDCCDCELLDVPGLNCSCSVLDCLRNSLRRVVVQFQVRLVKFLAQNGMVLEEVHIDGGSRHDSSCIDRKVARWRRAASRPSLLEEAMICRCCTAAAGPLSPLPASPAQAPAPPPPLWEFPPVREPRWRRARRTDLPVVTPSGRGHPFQPTRPPPASRNTNYDLMVIGLNYEVPDYDPNI